ncbi:hypothetical protein B0T25DRAFT_247702 [Lasiosphaeria hispida]|uniref:Uncharacterized protein n=1 Tax=Lasiosphaeria hispida TaxID=260671 RepID=A0AAJ0MCM6_9PEZI|nr:hypothetical protein B0T25DRAFT_247702 [Lasiosphaeria hispida]
MFMPRSTATSPARSAPCVRTTESGSTTAILTTIMSTVLVLFVTLYKLPTAATSPSRPLSPWWALPSSELRSSTLLPTAPLVVRFGATTILATTAATTFGGYVEGQYMAASALHQRGALYLRFISIRGTLGGSILVRLVSSCALSLLFGRVFNFCLFSQTCSTTL